MWNNENYKQEFVEYVTSLRLSFHDEKFTKKVNELKKILDKKTSHRIQVYQNSFRSRAISSLTEIIFHPIFNLYGEENVKQIVARYFAIYPPQFYCMIKSIENLPQFVLQNEDHYSKFFSEMARLCIEHWQFLILDNSQKFYFFQSHFNANYYEAWTLEEEKIDIDLFIPASENVLPAKTGTNILFYKTHPNIIEPLCVPLHLTPVVIKFIECENFETALEQITDEEIEQINPEELSKLIQAYMSMVFQNH